MSSLSILIKQAKSNKYLRIILLCLICLVPAGKLLCQPIVQSFAPLSGLIGDQIVISGSQFSANSANNKVFFGAVQATINASSANSLTVTVPKGASYSPISVLVNGLTASSSLPFLPRYDGGGEKLDDNSFGREATINTDYYPQNMIITDIDLDGKPDMLVLRYLPNDTDPSYVLAYRNISSGQSIEFDAAVTTECGVFSRDMVASDFDGDGKIDVATSNITTSELSILRNTSNSGNLSFAPRINFPAGDAAYNIAVADIDGDGKTDLLLTNYFDGKVTVLQNQSVPGSISFQAQPAMAAGVTPKFVKLADLNNDRKPDLIVANELVNSFSVYPNTSTVGSFSFGQVISFTTADNVSPKGLTIADVDMDGKNDIVVSTSGDIGSSSGSICVYRNSSQNAGIITLALGTCLPNVGTSGTFVPPVIADANGDGMPDIVSGRGSPSSVVSVYQNNSTSTVISFGTPQIFYSSMPSWICVGDLNSDGQPDIGCSSLSLGKVEILRNRTGQLSIKYLSPQTGGEGTEITLNGKHFTGVTSVTFGGEPATSFTVVSDTLLKAIVGQGSSGDILVQGVAGTDKWVGFVYDNTPNVMAINPEMARSSDTVTISGTNLLRTSNVRFGGVAAAWFTAKSANLILARPAENSRSGVVAVQTPGGTAQKEGFIFLVKPVITSFFPLQTFAGDEVSIYGKNLALPGLLPIVTIGGVQVESVYANAGATALYAKVGKGASGYVKVSHQGGADSVAGFIFTPPPYISSFLPVSANPTDTVVIKGRNFTGSTKVLFGDSLAKWFTVVSDILIKAVPGRSMSGSVNVVKYSGIGTLPGFIFLPFPPPSISSFMPGEAIAGSWLDIYGQNLWNIVSVAIGGIPVVEYLQLSTNQLRVRVPIGASGPISVVTDYGETVLSQPVFKPIQPSEIISIVPEAAEPGQTVTINGTGFGEDLNGVSVFFDRLKAVVTSAQNNKLEVKVPAYAGYGKISVTANNLTSLSPQSFTPINRATAVRQLQDNLFLPLSSLGQSGIAYDHQTMALDINGDGKPDIATLSQYGNLNYYINHSTPAKVSYQVVPGPTDVVGGFAMDKADFDGDGKTDIILFGYSWPRVGIARNISSGDSIGFEYTTPFIGQIKGLLADMNSDGKMDVITFNQSKEQAAIIFNNSTPGNIYFKDTLEILAGKNGRLPQLLEVADLDGDGRLDLLGVSLYDVLAYRNTGSKQRPAYDEPPEILTVRDAPLSSYASPQTVLAKDMNGDGFLDVLVSYGYSFGGFAVFKNRSSHGGLSFGKLQLIDNIITGPFFDVADFNGDDRPDVISGLNGISVFENISRRDSIMLGKKLYFIDATDAGCVVDFDGDNKQDVVSSSRSLYILRNRINEPIVTKICAGSSVDLSANLIGNSYQWQMDAGNGFTNIVNGSQFAGTSSNTLTITSTPSSWLKYQFRCLVGGDAYSEPYILEFSNSWEGTASYDWHNPANWSCGNVPDGNTDVLIPLWKVVNLTSDGTCRSVWLDHYATFNITPGTNFLITNK